MSDVRVPRLNSLDIVGRLTQQPRLAYTEIGTPAAKFRIAYSERVGGEDVVHFFSGIAYGNVAELLCEMEKGTPILILVKIIKQTRVMKRSGAKRSSVKIQAYSIQPLAKTEEDTTCILHSGVVLEIGRLN